MSGNIKGLSLDLGLDTIGIDEGLKGLKRKLSLVNSEMKSNMSAFDRSDKSVGKYSKQLEGLNKKLDVQKVATSQAKTEYEKMVQQHGEGSKQADAAARAYNNEAASLNNLERYIEGVSGELKGLQDQQKLAESGWSKMSESLTGTGKKLTSIGDSMKSVGKSMSMKVTAPIVAAGGAMFKFAKDQETAFAQVTTLLTGSSDDFDQYKSDIRDASSEMGVSMEDYSEAVYSSISAGQDQGDAIEFTRKAVKLAAGGFTETSKAVDVMTTALNAYGLGAEEADSISDMLITTQNLGKYLPLAIAI